MASDDNLCPFPELPLELCREILQTTAENNRYYIPSLRLVSSEVNQWMLPIFFRIVTLITGQSIDKFDAILDHLPTQDAIKCHIQVLNINSPTSRLTTLTRVLSACNSAESLALTQQALPNCLVLMRPKRLYVYGSDQIAFALMFGVPGPLWNNLTHVSGGRILTVELLTMTPDCLPSMTHTAVSVFDQTDLVERWLPVLKHLSSERPKLRLCILAVEFDEPYHVIEDEWYELLNGHNLDDPRFVVLKHSWTWDHFELPYVGKKDVYAVAEDIVAERFRSIQERREETRMT